MNIVFHAHSGLRWLILVGIILVLIKSLIGQFAGSNYTKFDKILGSSTVGFMDLQLVLGVILYFGYSTYTKNLAFNMSDTTARFWQVEHLLMMVIAIVVAHIGNAKVKKSTDDKAKFKLLSLTFGITLVLIMMAIPWDRI